MQLIGITGGIGAGKSIISHIAKSMQYEVYDCDLQAKKLMLSSSVIKKGLISLFGNEVYNYDSSLNRPFLSNEIFGNEEMRQCVNRIVHPVVCSDIANWAETLISNNHQIAFVESAILFESGIQKLTSAVIYVDAPEPLRIKRIVLRDCIDYKSAMARIESQRVGDAINRLKSKHHIMNDNTTPLIPQLISIINSYKKSEK